MADPKEELEKEKDSLPAVKTDDSEMHVGTLQPPASGSSVESRSRTPSPSTALTNATEFKVATQRSRLTNFIFLKTQCDELKADMLTTSELERRIDQLNKAWELFSSTHEEMGATCKRTFFTHPYMVDKVYDQACQLYNSALSTLYQHLSAVTNRTTQVNAHPTREGTHQRAKLPEIKLPQFDGDFAAWPSFRDLFSSLVIDNEQLTKVEKLHYLKTSIIGSAAWLISDVPLSSDSFEPAWQLITTTFNERLILSYIQKLFSNQRPVSTTAYDLTHLVNSTKETLDALTALGIQTEHWNYVLLYITTQRLDLSLREEWEVKRSSLQPPTKYEQLTQFIRARASALEAVLPSSTQKQSSTRAVPRPAHHASTHSSQSTQYPCDHCQGNHYIVTCPRFRDLTPTERRKIVSAQRLCYNCFGHHNLTSCQSSRTCKTCGSKHHTMIHLPSTAHQSGSTANSTRLGTSSQNSVVEIYGSSEEQDLRRTKLNVCRKRPVHSFTEEKPEKRNEQKFSIQGKHCSKRRYNLLHY